VDDIVSYLKERVVDKATALKPFDLEGGEHGRLLTAVDAWAVRIEREREEITQIRGFLDKDADRMNGLIQKCLEETRRQSQRLEAVRERVGRVGSDLRTSALNGTAPSPLAADVLETVYERLEEMRAAGDEMGYNWDQLRNLGLSMFQNVRLTGSPNGAA
jgi:chromosome segregation ATPase